MKNKISILLSCAVLLSPLAAQADLITSPIGATASSENFDAQGIGYTIDQSGLFTNYVSGVTDFDTYIATNPLHTTTANETAWYSARYDTDNAFVIYDMGSPFDLLRLALWNDEYSGFGQAIISSSLDGVNFSPLTTINPVDSPWGSFYGAQVFDLGVTARFLKFDLSGCPQPNGTPSEFKEYCGIGEVAFDVGITVADLDGDGVNNDADLCPMTLPGDLVDANGCSANEAVDLVIAELFALIDSPISDKARDKLGKAQDKLYDSLTELAQGDVKKGLKKIGDAVKQLLKAEKEGAGVADLIYLLVEAAWTQAQAALDSATARDGDPKKISKAQKELGKAADELAKGKPDKAIDRYAKAWDQANKA